MPNRRSANAHIALEIIWAYVRLRRRMVHGDVRDVVALARSPLSAVNPRDNQTVREQRALGRRLSRAVDRVLRPLPTDSRCLIQSILVCRLLASRGIASTVVLGARPGPQFTAHAWVEFQGQPVSPSLGFEEARLIEL